MAKYICLVGMALPLILSAQSRESKFEMNNIGSELPSEEQQVSEDLKKKHCVPCEGKVKAFVVELEQKYLQKVPKWTLTTEGIHSIARRFVFKDFKEAMSFVNAVADVAEAEGHHPDIAIFWNNVTLELHTHAIQGLSENDFILAAKIDDLLKTTFKRSV